MSLNEADTRILLIEPRLQAAGWRGTRVTREHYYRRDQAYTAGRISCAASPLLCPYAPRASPARPPPLKSS